MAERKVAFGGAGLVGEGLRADGLVVTPLSSDDVDITNIHDIEAYVLSSETPDVILLLSAYTNVDAAEADPLKALRINREGTQNVIRIADEYRIRVIAISTDMVFPGDEQNPGPYTEDATVPNGYSQRRIGNYANSKRLAEQIVLQSPGEHAVVRISFPFGSIMRSGDLIHKTTSLLYRDIPLVDDQILTPTYIPDLASVVEAITRTGQYGVFHVATSPTTSLYEFGSYVAKHLNLLNRVTRGNFEAVYGDEVRKRKSEKGVKISPRPQFGGLDATQTQERLGLTFHTWKEAVDDFFDRMKDINS